MKDIGELYEDLDAIHLKFEIRNEENGDYIMRSFYVYRKTEVSRSFGGIWNISEICQKERSNI